MRPSALLVALILLASCSGCARLLDHYVARAPNRIAYYKHVLNCKEEHVCPHDLNQQLCVRVGPPAANIWVGIVEPSAGQSPVGTVLVLHGIFSASSRSPANSMLATAKFLSKAGYRSVLVDLRGHYRSTGDFISAGTLEAEDLRQVLNVLAAKGLIGERVGIVGYSFGAGTALYLAERDPRVASIVAVAPPLRIREALPNFAWKGAPVTRYLFSNDDFQRALDRASLRYGIDPPDAADTEAAISKAGIPVMLVCAADDAIAPPSNGTRLRAASSGNAELTILAGENDEQEVKGHIRLIKDESGIVKLIALDWLNKSLRSQP